MTADVADLLAEIRRSGGDVRLIGCDRLKLVAPKALLPELTDRVRAAKPMLLAALADTALQVSTAQEGGGGVSNPRRNGATAQHPTVESPRQQPTASPDIDMHWLVGAPFMPPAKRRGSLGAKLKITGICNTGSARLIGNARAAANRLAGSLRSTSEMATACISMARTGSTACSLSANAGVARQPPGSGRSGSTRRIACCRDPHDLSFAAGPSSRAAAGSPLRLCRPRCRITFWSALRRWAERAVAADQADARQRRPPASHR